MFDLFRSRDKAVRFLLGAMLIVVAISMLTYLIPSYNMGGSQDNIVAEIGKETVTQFQVQRAIQNVTRGRSLPAEMLPHYVPQLIEQMITERALAFEARRLGFQVNDADIATAIRGTIPALFQDGKFVGTDAYSAFLAQQNTSIAEFEDEIARQVLVTRLRNVILEGVVVSPLEIEQEFRRRNEKVKIEYVKVSPEKLRSEVQVTPEEMRDYFSKNRSFQVPEKRSFQMIVLDPVKISEALTPSEAELRRDYQSNLDRFRTPERVKARHILLTTTGKSKEEEAQLQKKAEDLLKQVKSGADFAELARKNSQDPGSASKGGELPDWITRGQMVPEFEKLTFSLKPKEISGVVKTQYGFHIIQVLDKQEPHLKSFEEAKSELISEFKKQRVNDRVTELADKAQAALKKDPRHPEQVAAQFNLPAVKVDKVSPGDPVPEVGINRDFEAAITTLRKNEVTPPIVVPGNKMIVAVLTDVFPAHPAQFEEVESQIRQALTKQKLEKLVSDRASQLLEKAKALNGDLEKAAKSMGLELNAPDQVTRQGAIRGLGSASLVPDAFTKPDGALFGPVSVTDGKVAGKVISHTPANLAELASQRDNLREELKSKKARERNTLFEDGLRQQLVKEGKIKVHQQVLNRLTQGYRG